MLKSRQVILNNSLSTKNFILGGKTKMNNQMTKSNKRIIRSLKAELSVTRLYSIIMTIGFCIMGILYMNQCNETHNQKVNLNTKFENEIEELKSDYKLAMQKLADYSETIVKLTTISETLDAQNKELVNANEEYYNELSELRTKAELYDHYSYALVDSCGNRTDITYEQLETLEELLADSKVNDQDLILAWIMTESGGNEKCKNPESTAKGYGQFLDGTSKFVYCNLLNKTNWNPSVALDGETNLEMMVAYIEYLYEANDENLYDTIRSYRGKQDITKYVARIDSFLAYNDKSVYEISLSLKN